MIDNALAAVEQINAKLSAILADGYPDDRRITITAAFCNLALDHHTAIILLFRNKLYGSRLALVRATFEAMPAVLLSLLHPRLVRLPLKAKKAALDRLDGSTKGVSIKRAK